MTGLRYTLLSDGSSDQMLIHVINWAVRRCGVRVEQESWADLSFVRPKPNGLAERARRAVELYQCDVLFVHRDAEKEPFDHRLQEIRTAVADLRGRHVPVIPVRMTEAWFLHDELAIRRASGNPRGKVALNLPRVRDVELLPDPKEILFAALLAATEMTGRHREKRKRQLPRMRARVAEVIVDFEPLRGVPAFDHFIAELDNVVRELRATESKA